jgi:hypothetical protein
MVQTVTGRGPGAGPGRFVSGAGPASESGRGASLRVRPHRGCDAAHPRHGACRGMRNRVEGREPVACIRVMGSEEEAGA